MGMGGCRHSVSISMALIRYSGSISKSDGGHTMQIRLFAITGLVALASFKAANPRPHAPTTSNSFLIAIMVCLAVFAVPLRAADPHMSAEERTQVLKWLDD